MKAVVVEINNRNATLLRDDGQFIKKKNCNYFLGETIIMKNTKTKNRVLALATAAAMFVLLAIGGVFAYNTPYYYVSLDVNPSLVMEVNRLEMVIGMDVLNDDAAAIIENLDWKNKNINSVISQTIQEIDDQGYLDQPGDILIATSGQNNSRTVDLTQSIGDTIEVMNINDTTVSIVAVGYEMVQAANELGMTPGRYNLITNLLCETVDYDNMDEYNELSVKDLMSRFTEDKGSIGRQIASEARERAQDSDQDLNDLDEAEGDVPQEASEAMQKASEAREEAAKRADDEAQKATETLREVTETIPVAETSETEPTVPVETTENSPPTIDATSGAAEVILDADEIIPEITTGR